MELWGSARALIGPPLPYPTDARAPWLIHVLTIDPALFKGELVAARAANSVSRRHLVSDICRNRGAIVGVNKRYFVMKAADGVVGEDALRPKPQARHGVLTRQYRPRKPA